MICCSSEAAARVERKPIPPAGRIEFDRRGLLTLDGRVTDGNEEYFRIVGQHDDVKRGDIRWDAMTPPEFADLDRRSTEELKRTGVSTPFEKSSSARTARVPVLVGVAMLEGSENEPSRSTTSISRSAAGGSGDPPR
jgi:hypothetical protein